MPELPDLLYVRSRLERALVGRVVTGTHLHMPVVLRCLVTGGLEILVGQTLQQIDRRLHFLVFAFTRTDLVVNPMLAGRFRWAAAGDRRPAALAFELTFEARGSDASALQLTDTKQMSKAYLVPSRDFRGVPGIAAGGTDVLGAEFTLAHFASVVALRRDQVRVFLMDKDALDSLGNAYADEVLFAAGIHPKTWCRSLTPKDVARLHAAIVHVLRDAVAEVERRAEPIETKVRDFLKVRLKPVCPRCGAKIRRAGVRGMDAYFCPHCQPATRAGLVDWTRTGR